MKSQQLLLSIVFIFCCQPATAGKFTQLLDGSPGAQAKISRTFAKINIDNPNKQDQVGCNQDIGNVQQSKNSKIRENIVAINGDVINACK